MIIPLKAIDARYEPKPWSFAIEQRAEIDAHWQKLQAAKPDGLWNGTVLIQHRWQIEGGIYHAGYTDVDYASFLAWRDFGWPGPPVRNGFAMAALQGTDGAFVLGVMGPHTANAGKIYFPGGTPDLGDITEDKHVDLGASLLRELKEETGLSDDEFTVDERWFAAPDTGRIAFLKPTHLHLPAAEARELILSRLASLHEEELADIHIVRSVEGLDNPLIPVWAANFMRASFEGTLGEP